MKKAFARRLFFVDRATFPNQTIKIAGPQKQASVGRIRAAESMQIASRRLLRDRKRRGEYVLAMAIKVAREAQTSGKILAYIVDMSNFA
jgi:hypothetical protein